MALVRSSKRSLRSTVWQRGPKFPGFAITPNDPPQALCVGTAPLRVLIVGGGLGTGFGTHTHQTSLTGALCRALHHALGRGIVVTSRAAARVTIADVPSTLGSTGAHTYNAVVFTPNISSAIDIRPATWQRHATQMLEYLRNTATADIPVVLTGLPPFTFTGPHQNRVAAEREAHERTVRDFASPLPRTGYAALNTSPNLDTDTDYTRFYTQSAADITAALLPLLAHAR